MATRSSRKSKHKNTTKAVALPAGAPAWITEDLVRKTLEIWQPYYEQELIEEDAIAMIMGVGRIFEFLAESPRHEAIRCPGSRQ